MSYHGFTLRLPSAIFEEVKRRKRKSVAAFVVEAVEEKLAREKEEELRLGFMNLAGGVDREEIQPLLDAQKRALARADD